ncbi:MAG: CarD-like/TRCF domain protein [Lachnospiraceae bacterium]|nr:CarD-like/TRCF domain protein [Lachnospiraceae bacterium]
MFQKKEVIYSETIGVCIVDDIVKLADNKKDTYNYYLLRSVFDKTKKAYIPVENHTVQLRSLITLQEALTLQDEEHYDEKSEQEKGEVLYVTERAQESRTHQP